MKAFASRSYKSKRCAKHLEFPINFDADGLMNERAMIFLRGSKEKVRLLNPWTSRD